MCLVGMGEGVGGRCRLALAVAVGAGGAPSGAVHREEEAIWCVSWVKVTRRKEAVFVAARPARVSFEE